jgi:transketolase
MKSKYLDIQNEKKNATREGFGATLCELADEGVDIVAVDADLTCSTTTAKLGQKHPSRLINCGIAEQNMIDVAAGLSLTGKIAYTGSFAVFGTGRCYDQIRNTVCYSNLNVKICPTHAGVSVGPDGGSHQMLEDVALMSVLPNMKVIVPSDLNSACAALRLAAEIPGPVYVRMGRAKVGQVYNSEVKLEIGGANVLREGESCTIIANGVEVAESLKAADLLSDEGIECTVVDAYSVKPLDSNTILEAIKATQGKVVVCEEHSINGGLCDKVARLLASEYPTHCEFVAVNDVFGTSGEMDELMEKYELDANAICRAVKKELNI